MLQTTLPITILVVSRKPQYKNVYRRTIEMPQRARTFQLNSWSIFNWKTQIFWACPNGWYVMKLKYKPILLMKKIGEYDATYIYM